MSISDSIELFFDEFSDEEYSFNPHTIEWMAMLIKSGRTLKPVARSTSSPEWNSIKERWIKLFSKKSILPGASARAIFRNIKIYSGPSDEILHASELLTLKPAEATEELFRIIEEKNIPRIYENLDDYQANLARIVENKFSLTIIDAYLIEITPAVVKYISDSSDNDDIIKAIQNRVMQISYLIQGLTMHKSPGRPLKKITLVSVLTVRNKLEDKISNLSNDDEELSAKLKDTNLIKEACKEISDLILIEVGKRVPAVKELGLKVEIKDLKPAIDKKDLIRPHDRMIISNNAPEWCATAGFALDVRRNKIVTPQGYFLKFWRNDAQRIETESLPVTHIQY